MQKKILIRRNNYKLIIDENWITLLLLFLQYIGDFMVNNQSTSAYMSSYAVGTKNNNYSLIVDKTTKVQYCEKYQDPKFSQMALWQSEMN